MPRFAAFLAIAGAIVILGSAAFAPAASS